MSTYLCHGCASIRGVLGPIPKSDTLTVNSYQLDKFIKHTVPSSCASYKTVFSGVGSESYLNAIVNAYSSGGVEFDNHNRSNIFWVGSESNGIAYRGGEIVGITHGVKVVLYYDENKLHAFPIKAEQLRAHTCSECGRPVVI